MSWWRKPQNVYFNLWCFEHTATDRDRTIFVEKYMIGIGRSMREPMRDQPECCTLHTKQVTEFSYVVFFAVDLK